jgi:sialic acid synthase SpsE
MIRIKDRTVGAGSPCFIIAELGTSHMGNAERAHDLVDAAAGAGADCVKLQLVHADEILHPLSGTVELPTGRVELYAHFKALEKDVRFYHELKLYCERKSLVFLCSAFGVRSARELLGMKVSAMKIASPELNHFPLLREVSTYGIPLILSTGVSTLGDIERALAVAGKNVILLHCITAYPAPEEEYNLRVIDSLKRVFGIEAGVSDHSMDPALVPVLAVLKGACCVEKHFTLSRGGKGLDDPIALDPEAFRRMTGRIRLAEGDIPSARSELEAEYGQERVRKVEGSGMKELAPSEKANYERTNRSIHALEEIPRGTVITAEMVAVLRTEKMLRPGLGPEFLEVVLGASAQRRIPAGEGIIWEDLIAR